tara:strand:+ start:1450 stop:1638 length:189 start_codon:yes stop_codon:yes gene_type:complete
MEQIIITCIDNGMNKEADVLSRTDKYMKVAVQGTTMTIELTRTDLNRPYIGTKAGLEFSYND